jgi:hypothetical protein
MTLTKDMHRAGFTAEQIAVFDSHIHASDDFVLKQLKKDNRLKQRIKSRLEKQSCEHATNVQLKIVFCEGILRDRLWYGTDTIRLQSSVGMTIYLTTELMCELVGEYALGVRMHNHIKKAIPQHVDAIRELLVKCNYDEIQKYFPFQISFLKRPPTEEELITIDLDKQKQKHKQKHKQKDEPPIITPQIASSRPLLAGLGSSLAQKKRGRPRKHPEQTGSEMPKRKRGRPRKNQDRGTSGMAAAFDISESVCDAPDISESEEIWTAAELSQAPSGMAAAFDISESVCDAPDISESEEIWTAAELSQAPSGMAAAFDISESVCDVPDISESEEIWKTSEQSQAPSVHIVELPPWENTSASSRAAKCNDDSEMTHNLFGIAINPTPPSPVQQCSSESSPLVGLEWTNEDDTLLQCLIDA